MRRQIQISGTVQGVGFRPFVYNLALRFGLSGWVRNSMAGVEIEAQGARVGSFIDTLRSSPPPLAIIEHISVYKMEPYPNPGASFVIEPSSSNRQALFARTSPDIATCSECVKELKDRFDRRSLYPFINCTNCGPRYSIIQRLPYDRAGTTMNAFTMCGACRKEYTTPGNRRFHAQPNCCKECGPTVWTYRKGSGISAIQSRNGVVNYGAVKEAQQALKEGAIVAIKGLGGFHIACDAENPETLKRLRSFKRPSFNTATGPCGRPFAIMAQNLASAKELAVISEEEERVLTSASSPILLLLKRAEARLPEEVAPHSLTYGIMLPYTPLHHLLFHKAGASFRALVMTSGNNSGSPIITGNREAVETFSAIADLFLLHDREIESRVDDSIVQVVGGRTTVLRAARGLTPKYAGLGTGAPDAIAFGTQQKNTLCIGTKKSAILSPHIGDLGTIDAVEFQEKSAENLLRLNGVTPSIVAHDSHPGYASTRAALKYAEAHSVPKERIFAVQHHHAHIVSCMVEHALQKRVIGVAFDGTGAGQDGNVWGGEFIVADRATFKRAAHLRYLPMAGKDRAIEEPWRMGLACILDACNNSTQEAKRVAGRILDRVPEERLKVVLRMLVQKVNSPLTSSAGRLFDAVASLSGICDFATYEGEAAIRLESAAGAAFTPKELYEFKPYGYSVTGPATKVIDTGRMIKSIVDEVEAGTTGAEISGRFHATVAAIITDVCGRISAETGLKEVVLSGGVFQNRLLCLLAQRRLSAAGFTPYFNCAVPSNDGGIALGQLAVAVERFAKQKKSRRR